MTLADAVAALGRGEVVALPTESSYGLAVDARSTRALAQLFALKWREASKPPPVLVGSEEMLDLVVASVSPRARALIARFWPGALTLVLPARPGLPEALIADGGVGVRRSPHAVADGLARAFGPITATSANRSGAPPAMTAAEVRAAFGPDLLILDGGPATGAAPSTVVRVNADDTLTVLRAGAIDPALLL